MNKVRGTLEYHVVKRSGKRKARWSFRFKTPHGDTLVESARTFESQAQAEQGFVSFIKSIATNQYQVTRPEHSMN